MPMILWSINCHYSKQPNPRYNYTSQCVIITKSLTHSGVATQNWNASIKLQKMMYGSNIPQYTSRFRYYLHSMLVAGAWNNGKSGAKLDLTSLTTPGLQIRVIGCRVAVPRSYWSAVPTPLFIYISQLLRDSFSVSQQPPIWEPPSHYSIAECV